MGRRPNATPKSAPAPTTSNTAASTADFADVPLADEPNNHDSDVPELDEVASTASLESPRSPRKSPAQSPLPSPVPARRAAGRPRRQASSTAATEKLTEEGVKELARLTRIYAGYRDKYSSVVRWRWMSDEEVLIMPISVLMKEIDLIRLMVNARYASPFAGEALKFLSGVIQNTALQMGYGGVFGGLNTGVPEDLYENVKTAVDKHVFDEDFEQFFIEHPDWHAGPVMRIAGKFAKITGDTMIANKFAMANFGKKPVNRPTPTDLGL